MIVVTTDTNAALLRRVEHFKRRCKDQATRIVQLEYSREKWKQRALAEAKDRQTWQRKWHDQHTRAELWKHRAMTKFPIPSAGRGGAPRFVDYDEARDYFEEHEAS